MPKKCKFIDDEAELSDNDENGKKITKRRKIESSDDEDQDDVPNEKDLAFIDDTLQVDNKSDASSIHSSEDELCSGDELIIREAKGSRVRQVQDSFDDFDDEVEEEEDEETDDDACAQHQSSIQHYFKRSLKPEISSETTSNNFREKLNAKLVQNKPKLPEHLRNLKNIDMMKRDAVTFGHHVTEDEKPIQNVEQVKSSWDFLSSKSTQVKQKESIRIPGMIRTPEGLFYENKNGKRIRVNETA